MHIGFSIPSVTLAADHTGAAMHTAPADTDAFNWQRQNFTPALTPMVRGLRIVTFTGPPMPEPAVTVDALN